MSAIQKHREKDMATKKAIPDGLAFKYFDLQITLLEPQLGTVPKNPEIYKKFIENLKPEDQQDDESKTVEARENQGWTGFHRDEYGVFIYDYMLKGFLKNAGNIIKEQMGVKALKSKIVNFVFVKPRRVHFDMTNAMKNEELVAYLGTGEATVRVGENGLAILERPLRAETMQGPRVTLVASDVVGSGATLKAVLKVLDGPISEKILRNIVDYGQLQGLGQWRSAGWGSFDATIEKCDEDRIKDYESLYVAAAAD